jgi:hypothetical protein
VAACRLFPVVACLAFAGACASESNAQVALSASDPIVRDDTSSLARLLDGVRGVNPLAGDTQRRHARMVVQLGRPER